MKRERRKKKNEKRKKKEEERRKKKKERRQDGGRKAEDGRELTYFTLAGVSCRAAPRGSHIGAYLSPHQSPTRLQHDAVYMDIRAGDLPRSCII